MKGRPDEDGECSRWWLARTGRDASMKGHPVGDGESIAARRLPTVHATPR